MEEKINIHFISPANTGKNPEKYPDGRSTLKIHWCCVFCCCLAPNIFTKMSWFWKCIQFFSDKSAFQNEAQITYPLVFGVRRRSVWKSGGERGEKKKYVLWHWRIWGVQEFSGIQFTLSEINFNIYKRIKGNTGLLVKLFILKSWIYI